MAEQGLGAPVPAGDASAQILADDGVDRAVDDGGQLGLSDPHLVAAAATGGGQQCQRRQRGAGGQPDAEGRRRSGQALLCYELLARAQAQPPSAAEHGDLGVGLQHDRRGGRRQQGFGAAIRDILQAERDRFAWVDHAIDEAAHQQGRIGPAGQVGRALGWRRDHAQVVDRQQEQKSRLGGGAGLHQLDRRGQLGAAAAHRGQRGAPPVGLGCEVQAERHGIAVDRFDQLDHEAVARGRGELANGEPRVDTALARHVGRFVGLGHPAHVAEAARAGKLVYDIDIGEVARDLFLRHRVRPGHQQHAAQAAQHIAIILDPLGDPVGGLAQDAFEPLLQHLVVLALLVVSGAQAQRSAGAGDQQRRQVAHARAHAADAMQARSRPASLAR